MVSVAVESCFQFFACQWILAGRLPDLGCDVIINIIIMSTVWVGWDRMLEMMMDIATPRRMLNEVLDDSERVHLMKIMITIRPRSAQSDVWPLRNSILDMHRSKILGCPHELKVKIEIHPK